MPCFFPTFGRNISLTASWGLHCHAKKKMIARLRLAAHARQNQSKEQEEVAIGTTAIHGLSI